MSGSAVAPVSVIVLTLNEETNVGACLASVTGWTSRVFVVDSGSTDRTVEIARRQGAEVVEHPFEHYGVQRNWALDHLPIDTPWVLELDAGERVTTELRDAIVRVSAGPPGAVRGYVMKRRTIFMGRWIRHGGLYPTWQLRLFQKGYCRCEERLYDQHRILDGPVGRLEGDLVDHVSADLASLVRRHIKWAEMEAREELGGGESEGRLRGGVSSDNPIVRRRWVKERYARLPLFGRSIGYFVWRYVVRLGFLDGREGLIYHGLQCLWYRFLVDALVYERRRADQAR